MFDGVGLVPEVLDAELVAPSVDGGGRSSVRSSPQLVERVVLVLVRRRRRELRVAASTEVVDREASEMRGSGWGSSRGAEVRRGRRVRDHVGRVGVSLSER